MDLNQAVCSTGDKLAACLPHMYLAVLIGLFVVVLLCFVASIHHADTSSTAKGLENKAVALGIIATLISLYFAH